MKIILCSKLFDDKIDQNKYDFRKRFLFCNVEIQFKTAKKCIYNNT